MESFAAISTGDAWGILIASAVAAGIVGALLLRGPYWVFKQLRHDPVAFWLPTALIALLLALGLFLLVVVYLKSDPAFVL